MSHTVQIVNEKTELVKSAAATSLAAVTATGAGTATYLGSVRANHAIQVTYTSNPTAVAVNLEGSLDGTNWRTLGSWSIAGGQASGDIVWITGKAAIWVRANLATLTGGTSPAVTATIASA